MQVIATAGDLLFHQDPTCEFCKLRLTYMRWKPHMVHVAFVLTSYLLVLFAGGATASFSSLRGLFVDGEGQSRGFPGVG